MPPADLRPPSIVFNGRHWPSDELAALAEGWLEILHDSMPATGALAALPLINHPEAVALFFALSSFPFPVVVLPPDARAWRSSPPIPAGTPVFLLPEIHALARDAETLGLTPIALTAPRPPSRTRGVAFLTMPGIVEFTSGSTGLPKPVHVLTRSVLRQVATIVETCRLSPGDAVAGGLPLATAIGLVRNLFVTTVLGSTLGLLERFDHRALLNLFASGPYVHWMGTPFMADMLARAPLSGPVPAVPPSCHIGAGKLPERVFHAFRARFGVPPRPGYGLTENGTVTVEMAPDDEIRPACVGRPYPGIEIRVGDDPLDPLAPGRRGRIWFTSPWYMEGYGFPPRLAPRERRDAWWPTPDVGSLDETGYLTLIGRVDDCFKTSSGHLANPAEVADALLMHAGVTDAVVLPVSHDSSALIGALVEGDAVTVDGLRATAAQTLPPWLRPHVLVVTAQLPRLAGGKVDRAACGAILREAGGSRIS